MKTFWILIFALFVAAPAAQAQTISFESWLADFRAEARNQGISEPTLNAALTGIKPLPRVIELDRKQPEHKMTFAQYKQRVISQQRINRGRELMAQHAQELKWVEQTYGVAPQYVVALWGVETSFGTNTGGFKVVDSLATLAWEGRRAAFFKTELLKALKIIDQGHISAADMKGSWAGAMGQNQFMPSSFFNFAVDANGDGKRDIWSTRLDVFASTANYLAKSGWVSGQRWGRAVRVPANFPADEVGPKIIKPLSYWTRLGVTDINGNPLPSDDIDASIVAPDGLGGETYIVYNNYQSIMKWNRSTYFATSVGLIADAIAR